MMYPVLIPQVCVRDLHWTVLLPVEHRHHEVKVHGDERLKSTARICYKTVWTIKEETIHKWSSLKFSIEAHYYIYKQIMPAQEPTAFFLSH